MSEENYNDNTYRQYSDNENRYDQDTGHASESGDSGQSRYRYQSTYNERSRREDARDRKKKNRGGRIALILLLAAIFGICAGLGAWGINRAMGTNGPKITISGSITRSGDRDGKNQEAGTGDEDADGSESAASEDEGSAAGSAKEKTKSSGKSAAQSDHDVEYTGSLELVQVDPVETNVTQVAENVMPAIVSVYNNYTVTRQDWFGQTYSQDGQSTGSGIIISLTDDELLVATNNHVVEGEDSLEVQFINEETAEANIKGTDPANDLAVIAVSLEDIDEETLDSIRVATLGDSDNLKIGEPVVAIGNALGYGQSVTDGIISALNREMTTEDGEANRFIQTNAAINPGNSGGALVDMHGNVIGINSNKIGGSTVEGMGYAIPTARAVPIINNLMVQSTKTKVDTDNQGYLGIRGVSVTSQVASAYDMPQGVYIAELIEGGGAAASEMKKGDIVTQINGSTVRDMEELQKQLQYYEAGEAVTVTVKRAVDGEYVEKEIEVTLGDKGSVQSDADSGSGRGNRSGSDSGQSGSGRQQDPDGGSSGSGSYFYGFPWGNFFGF